MSTRRNPSPKRSTKLGRSPAWHARRNWSPRWVSRSIPTKSTGQSSRLSRPGRSARYARFIAGAASTGATGSPGRPASTKSHRTSTGIPGWASPPSGPFLAHYYHPGEWRKRLDFGTGTFGDMGCHILDPVFTSLALTAPSSIRSEGGAPNGDNWGLDSKVRYTFPGTKHTTETLSLFWYESGNKRPPAEVVALIGKEEPLSGQGSIYIGDQGSSLRAILTRPCCFQSKNSRRPSSQVQAETTTISNLSKHVVETVKPRRPSITRGHSPSLSCWAAWRRGFPRRLSNGTRWRLKVTNLRVQCVRSSPLSLFGENHRTASTPGRPRHIPTPRHSRYNIHT